LAPNKVDVINHVRVMGGVQHVKHGTVWRHAFCSTISGWNVPENCLVNRCETTLRKLS